MTSWEERMSAKAQIRIQKLWEQEHAEAIARERKEKEREFRKAMDAKFEDRCAFCWRWQDPDLTNRDHWGNLFFGWFHKTPDWWQPSEHEEYRLWLYCSHACHTNCVPFTADEDGRYLVAHPPIPMAFAG